MSMFVFMQMWIMIFFFFFKEKRCFIYLKNISEKVAGNSLEASLCVHSRHVIRDFREVNL